VGIEVLLMAVDMAVLMAVDMAVLIAAGIAVAGMAVPPVTGTTDVPTAAGVLTVVGTVAPLAVLTEAGVLAKLPGALVAVPPAPAPLQPVMTRASIINKLKPAHKFDFFPYMTFSFKPLIYCSKYQ
jgi:hypothetical protein